jgi:hypothetical protein
MKNHLLAIALFVLTISGCGVPATPTLEQTVSPTAAIMSINSSNVVTSTSTHISVLPTATPVPLATLPASPTPLLFTDPSIPLSERIVYYYFVTPAENPIPEGSVITASFVLAPTYSDETYTSDTAATLRTALEIVLHDDRNLWISNKLEIVDVTFRNGHADVILQGEYFGMGGAVLEAASMQILLTVFANSSMQTATVTLNGDTIGNLGISNSMNAKSANYVFTRAEIETFINEHAYVSP